MGQRPDENSMVRVTVCLRQLARGVRRVEGRGRPDPADLLTTRPLNSTNPLADGTRAAPDHSSGKGCSLLYSLPVQCVRPGRADVRASELGHARAPVEVVVPRNAAMSDAAAASVRSSRLCSVCRAP